VRVVRVDVEKREHQSALEALWALGALEPKKRLSGQTRGLGLWWKGCRKLAPRAAVFWHRHIDYSGNPHPHSRVLLPSPKLGRQTLVDLI
jgi:hypothetical protein